MRVSRGRCLLPNWIEKKGWTQAEYARRSGRHKRVISHFCNGERVVFAPKPNCITILAVNMSFFVEEF